MDYNEAIYNLLLDYLPGIGSALSQLESTVSGFQASLLSLVDLAGDHLVFLALIAFTAVLALVFKRRFLI